MNDPGDEHEYCDTNAKFEKKVTFLLQELGIKTENDMDLTKDEAITALREGKKIRHRYFFAGDWMKLEGDATLVFEDGNKEHWNTFFRHRNTREWESGYSIVE